MFAQFVCEGLLHNNLDGLQGGAPLAAPPEYYHLSAAEHAFVADIVLNGSGVLASHTELTDIGTNTHVQIDSHIADTTIHFTAAEMNALEIDPIFVAERSALTNNYLAMKGPATLVDSPAYVVGTVFVIGGSRLEIIDSNSNTVIGINSLSYNTTGTYNTSLGVNAGRLLFDEVSENDFSTHSLYLGANTLSGDNTSDNESVIGYYAIGHGSNTMTFGNLNVTDNYFTGNVLSTASFVGEKVQFGSSSVYITYDISGNMVFTDDVVGAEVTLSDLLAGGGGGEYY
jgi:hypothetical protein